MAFLQTKNIAIKGVSACVPKNLIENKDNKMFSSEELDRFYKTVGIERRHCVNEGMTTADLCFVAAEKLIADLKWNKEEIDALILVTQTPDYRNPASSCILQDRLGLKSGCMAFDISMGCSGYVYGLSVISKLMAGGQLKKTLLLVGDTPTLISSPEDKSRALLFGDAGTATALMYDESAEDMLIQLATDGSGFKAIYTPDSGFRNRINQDSFKMVDYGGGIVRAKIHSWLDGLDVFSFGIKRAPQSMNQLIEHFNLDKEDIDYFLFHQANMMMNEMIRKKLKLPKEKVPYHLKNYGNTSCATIPLLMVTNLKEEIINQQLSVIMCAFGVGLSWGNVYAKLDDVFISDLQYL